MSEGAALLTPERRPSGAGGRKSDGDRERAQKYETGQAVPVTGGQVMLK